MTYYIAIALASIFVIVMLFFGCLAITAVRGKSSIMYFLGAVTSCILLFVCIDVMNQIEAKQMCNKLHDLGANVIVTDGCYIRITHNVYLNIPASNVKIYKD